MYKIYKSVFTLIILVFLCVPFYVFGQMETGDENKVVASASVNEKITNSEYLIGVGDVLDIRIYNRPQLSRDTVRVDGRGMIRMPLIKEEIRAVCRTDSELAKEISKQYLEYLKYPHVDVFIKDFQSKPAAVIGAVREPGRFQMQRQIRLLELISFAGGPTEQAGGRVLVRHAPTNNVCRTRKTQSENGDEGGETISWFDLKELMLGENLNEENNPIIRPGDIVNLIEADKVYVIGNVFKPTAISLTETMTLTQAIAIAGGTLQDTNSDRIRISRQSVNGLKKTEIIADLKAIKSKNAEDIVLRANDIVEVPTSSGKKFVRGLLSSIVPGIMRLPVRVIR